MRRYYSPTIRQYVKELNEARERKSTFLGSHNTTIQLKFDDHYKDWMKVVDFISQLDCLMSLAKSRHSFGDPVCRPQFVESDQAMVQFKELYHPCLKMMKDFIPNDVRLGAEDPSMLIVTGANMGGKSTLLRQVSILILLLICRLVWVLF